MKKMKKLRKSIALVLTLVMSCFQITTIMANEPTFDLARVSDDTIIAYYDDQPITKGDIDENHIINPTILHKGVPSYNTVTLPSNRSMAIVKKELTAPRFTQYTEDAYLTKSEAITLANKLAVSSTENFVYLLAGFTPHIGSALTISLFVYASYRNELASEINNQLIANNPIRFRTITSPYGTFYAVDFWNGRHIELEGVYETGSGISEKVISYSYK